MNPNTSASVRIYSGYVITRNDQFIDLKWSKDFGIMVYWESDPIKIRSFLISKNTIPASLIDVKQELSTEEYKDFKSSPSKWQTYQFSLIPQGKYGKCH